MASHRKNHYPSNYAPNNQMIYPQFSYKNANSGFSNAYTQPKFSNQQYAQNQQFYPQNFYNSKCNSYQIPPNQHIPYPSQSIYAQPQQTQYDQYGYNKPFSNFAPNSGNITNFFPNHCNFSYINNYYFCNQNKPISPQFPQTKEIKKIDTSIASSLYQTAEDQGSEESPERQSNSSPKENTSDVEENSLNLSNINKDIEKLLNCLNLDEDDYRDPFQTKPVGSFKFEVISEKIHNLNSAELKQYLSTESNKEDIDFYFFTLKNESKQLEIESLYNNIKPLFLSMINVEIASLTLRKFYFLISQERLLELWDLLQENFTQHCVGEYSTKSIQWLISELSNRDKNNQILVVSRIEEYLYKLATMKNGCNILKRIINVFEEKALEKIEAFIALNFYTLSTNMYSYHVLIAYFKVVSEKYTTQKDKKLTIVNSILKIIDSLMNHEIGSKIVAKTISYLGLSVCKPILSHIAYKIHIYSTNRRCIGIIHVILDYLVKDKLDEEMKYHFCLYFTKLNNSQLLKIFTCRRAYNIMSKTCSMLNKDDKKRMSKLLFEFSSSLNSNPIAAKKLSQRIKNIMCMK